MKWLAIIAILALLLTGCSSDVVEEVNEPETIEVEEPEPEVETIPEPEEKAPVADIIIVDKKLDPNEVEIPLDELSTITIHNQEDKINRIDLWVYGAVKSVNINPNSYEMIDITPTTAGRYKIDLNGVHIGYVVVS